MRNILLFFVILLISISGISQDFEARFERQNSFNNEWITPFFGDTLTKMGARKSDVFHGRVLLPSRELIYWGADISYQNNLDYFSQVRPSKIEDIKYDLDTRILRYQKLYLGLHLSSADMANDTRFYASIGPVYESMKLDFCKTNPNTGANMEFADTLSRFGGKLGAGFTYLSLDGETSKFFKRVDIYGEAEYYPQNISVMNYRYNYEFKLNINLIQIMSIANSLYLTPTFTVIVRESELLTQGNPNPVYYGGLALASQYSGLDLVRFGWGGKYYSDQLHNIGYFYFSVDLGALRSMFLK